MLTCDLSTIVWPSWRVYAVGAAAQVPCVVLLHVVGLALYLLSRDRRLAFLLWPAAVAIALAPLYLLPLAEALLPAGYAADAQLGRFFAATAASFAAFRTVEAALGATPVGATLSLPAWLLYFTSAIDPRYAEGGKTVKAAPGAALARLARVPVRMVALGALISLLRPYDRSSALAAWLAAGAGLGPTAVRCATNVVTSPAIWLFLAMCFDLGAVPLLAQGVDATEAFANPVFASRDVKTFWGKRWNLQVNSLLRRTCFKPFRRHLGATGAALGTFAVSALFHEYQFAVTFGETYARGQACWFFGAMAALCTAQSLCERSASLNRLAAATPLGVAVVSNLVVMSPFGHLFYDIWARYGMMDTMAKMVPTLACKDA